MLTPSYFRCCVPMHQKAQSDRTHGACWHGPIPTRRPAGEGAWAARLARWSTDQPRTPHGCCQSLNKAILGTVDGQPRLMVTKLISPSSQRSGTYGRCGCVHRLVCHDLQLLGLGGTKVVSCGILLANLSSCQLWRLLQDIMANLPFKLAQAVA